MFIVFVLSFILFAQACQKVRRSAEDLQCQSNIFSIGYGLQSFREYYGCYPPPFITDQNGKPLYSWRVFLLPQYGIGEAYDEFDFTKPWNDPANLHLCKGKNDWLLKLLFTCPFSRDTENIQTNYFCAHNVQDQWPRDYFIDSQSAPQILLVESHARHVFWSEPVDVDYREPGVKSLLGKLRESKAVHEGGFTCFVSDGSYPRIPADSNPELDLPILKLSVRMPRTSDDGDKKRTDRFVARLTKILDDAPYHNRHMSLLLLGELGPQAKPAAAMIHRVMSENDKRLNRVAALALAKIER